MQPYYQTNPTLLNRLPPELTAQLGEFRRPHVRILIHHPYSSLEEDIFYLYINIDTENDIIRLETRTVINTFMQFISTVKSGKETAINLEIPETFLWINNEIVRLGERRRPFLTFDSYISSLIINKLIRLADLLQTNGVQTMTI